MTHQTIRLEPAGDAAEGLWLLTLNRPEAMNAMNTQMFIDLRAAMRELAVRADARVLVITGAGERAFSVGGDLKERNGMSDETWRAQHQLIEEAFLAVKDFALPVIAAVEGHAHGGGLELALMCDFIIASNSAVFSLPEVKRGILPGGGGVQNLVRAAGMRRAKQLLFSGGSFKADQALDWGMVNEAVAPGTALARSLEIAREIVAAAPMSVRYVKLAAARGGEVDFHTGYMLDLAAYNVLVSSQDRLEGVQAFNERRAPKWRNR
ncbi:MAG: enoyl-CoA hydratase-related protein [Betaproteobacteria bacterium]